ncbi:MAG TPA: LysM peptidoglycan-binding domain-containing protein, partial [Gammaproteobacteria bacterium]
SEAAAAATKTGAGDYTVTRGDSLWRISGKSEVYGNPYQWPLIYKANRSKIKDADLIYPGQQLTIDRNASDADIKAAVKHAKTRGAWSLGVVEESDRAYLSR